MFQNHLVGAAVANTTTAVTGSVVFAMTDAVVISIVGGIVSLITGVATIYFAYKAKVISAEAKEVSVHTGVAVNGKMEEFKRMAEEFYHAKGVADEKLSADAKAGIAAVAEAKGKAMGEAVKPLIAVAPIMSAAAPAAVAAQAAPPPAAAVVETAKSTTRIADAIDELTDAAEETSESADKTVDLAKKHPRPDA